MNRSLVTLIIITFVIIIFVILLVLTPPVIVREFAYFIESFPLYVRRLHALATDSKPALGAQNHRRGLGRLSGRSAILRRWRATGSVLSCVRYGRVDEFPPRQKYPLTEPGLRLSLALAGEARSHPFLLIEA